MELRLLSSWLQNWEIIRDYPGGPSVITSILENRRGRPKKGVTEKYPGKRWPDRSSVACFEYARRGPGAKKHGYLQKLEKMRKWNLPYSFQKGTQP